MIEAGTGWNVRAIRRPDGEDEAEGDAMATATWNFDENEVIAAAAKQLGIKLTKRSSEASFARHGPVECFRQRSTMTTATWTRVPGRHRRRQRLRGLISF